MTYYFNITHNSKKNGINTDYLFNIKYKNVISRLDFITKKTNVVKRQKIGTSISEYICFLLKELELQIFEKLELQNFDKRLELYGMIDDVFNGKSVLDIAFFCKIKYRKQKQIDDAIYDFIVKNYADLGKNQMLAIHENQYKMTIYEYFITGRLFFDKCCQQ